MILSIRIFKFIYFNIKNLAGTRKVPTFAHVKRKELLRDTKYREMEQW